MVWSLENDFSKALPQTPSASWPGHWKRNLRN
jgi:hypothetical protein